MIEFFTEWIVPIFATFLMCFVVYYMLYMVGVIDWISNLLRKK